MSNSVAPAMNAAAGITRRHPRITKFAAAAAVAGVLGSAGFAVGSAAVAQAAAKPAAGNSGTAVQLDAFQSGAVGATATAFSHSAAHQAAHPAVNTTKHAVRKATTKPAPPKHAATKAATHQAAPAKPYRMYDSVTPSSLPAGAPAAAYTNGAYAASYKQVASHKSVLWIDTNGSNRGATALDVEPGDATPAGAALWVQQRLTTHPHSVAIVYTMMSDWQQVKADIAHLPQAQQHNVRYWIADPTGVNHMVPGADATQWYWGSNIDISTANPSLTQAS